MLIACGLLQAAETPPAAASNEVVYIDKYNCTQLMAESDAARSSALLFYYGYAMGQRKVIAYQPPQMGQHMQNVLAICKRNPDMPVSVAYNTVIGG